MSAPPKIQPAPAILMEAFKEELGNRMIQFYNDVIGMLWISLEDLIYIMKIPRLGRNRFRRKVKEYRGYLHVYIAQDSNGIVINEYGMVAIPLFFNFKGQHDAAKWITRILIEYRKDWREQ